MHSCSSLHPGSDCILYMMLCDCFIEMFNLSPKGSDKFVSYYKQQCGALYSFKKLKHKYKGSFAFLQIIY